MNIEFFFPTPIWWEDTGIDCSSIENMCLNERFKDPIGRILSNQGGWQSFDFRPGTKTELLEVESKILQQSLQCVRDYGYDENAVVVFIENLWININGKNNTNSVHIHDNSFVSGVFYVRAKPGQGNINFYKSYNHDFIVASQAPIKNYTAISAAAMTYPPITGRLMMFPGHLPHGVERNTVDEERISISFNVKILRKEDGLYWTKNFK